MKLGLSTSGATEVNVGSGVGVSSALAHAGHNVASMTGRIRMSHCFTTASIPSSRGILVHTLESGN